MDDLDLEKLKQELHGVFDSDLYDVDQIMEEEGASGFAGDSDSMEELLKSLGAPTEEPDGAEATDPAAALKLAAQQTEALAEEQAELRGEPEQDTDEADEIFSSLFRRLDDVQETLKGELPEEPVTTLTGEMPEEPEDTPEEPEDTPDEPENAPDEPENTPEEPEDMPEPEDARPTSGADYEALIERAARRAEAPDGETMEEPPKRFTQSEELVSQIVMALEAEKDDAPSAPEADTDEAGEPAEDAPLKGFFSRLFSPIEEVLGEGEDDFGDEDEYEEELNRIDEASDFDVEDDEPEEIWNASETGETESKPGGFLSRLLSPLEEALRESGDEYEDESEDEYEDEEAFDAADESAEESADVTADAGEDADEPEDADEITDAPEEPKEPQPRPEDTPVISEEELAEFLSDVDADEPRPLASFEELLEDSGGVGETEELKPQPPVPEEFPKKTTTVYVDVPIREKPEDAEEPRRTELFDAAAELEKEPPEPEEPEEPKEPEEPEELPDIPEPEPEWMTESLEKLSQIAPPLAELRRDGPVMAREVLRRREWIEARIRGEQAEQAGEPAEDAETQTPIAETPDGEPPVFRERPIGTPETETVGRETEPKEPEELNAPEEPEEQNTPEEPEKPEERNAPEEPEETRNEEAEEKPDAAPEQEPETPAWSERSGIDEAQRKTAAWKLGQADKDCRRRMRSQKPRSIALGILTIICIYISCAADFTILPLPDAVSYVSSTETVLWIFLSLLALSVLLAYDVVLDGIRAALHRSPNLSTLVDAAVALNIAHCFACLAVSSEEIPFACLAMLILFVQLRAQMAEETVHHAVYKVAGTAKEPVGLYWHDGKKPHLFKARLRDVEPFAARAVSRAERERVEKLLTLSALVLAVILSALVCVSTGDFGRLIYVLAATLTGAGQIALLSASALARSGGARRMARSGAAADTTGAARLAETRTVVLTDEDLFPKGSVALEKLELRSNLNDATALAYAAALTDGSSLGSMLAEEVRTRYGMLLAAHHVVRYTGGGVSGRVGKLEVLLGGEDFMAERGIFTGSLAENALALALDGSIAAILTIDYSVPAVLFHAMQKLTEQKTTIWLHSRNHQVTAELTERLYGLRQGTILVPELEQDRALQDPRYTERAQLCGMLQHDGLTGLADCVCAARAQTRAERAGMLIGICASALCMLLLAYLCYIFVPADAHPTRVLIYMVLCFVPIFFMENGVGRE